MPALCDRCRKLADQRAAGPPPHKGLRSVRGVARVHHSWERLQCFDCGARWDKTRKPGERNVWQLAAL